MTQTPEPTNNSEKSLLESRLEHLKRAIRIYCEGVKQDFPETTVWMDNIIIITEKI